MTGNDPVHEIKERLSIVDVVGQYVRLTKAGKNYRGLSPFKKEKTPSFYVSPDKGMYYDFSSGQGGDIFTFVQAMDGLDFRGALHMLAERAGVALREESKSSRDRRDQLYHVLETACQFFETKFSEHPEAKQYLVDRGLEDMTTHEFRIGLAPDAWDTLFNHLTTQSFDPSVIEEAGLIKKSERGSYYDRFRSRVMFPIMDSAGRVVAFSGRIFGQAAENDKNAKYLNSPETPLFDKSRVLYGYHRAKQHIRKYDFSILVEGQMDLVLSHQSGYPNTVAVSGTGLTPHHLELLRKLSKRLVSAFDADGAGVASTGRAAVLALDAGMDLKVVTVPHGKDPADCIKNDVEQWKQAVRDATHIVDYQYRVTYDEQRSRKNGDERALIIAVRDNVLPFVARVRSGVEQAHFVRSIAQRLSLTEESVWQDVRAISRNLARESAHPRTNPPHSHPTTHHTPPQKQSRRQDVEEAIAGMLFYIGGQEQPVLTEEDTATLASKYGVDLAAILARGESNRDQLAFQSEIRVNDDTKKAAEVLETLFRTLSREQLIKERESIAKALREAEYEHDDEQVATLLARFTELARRIDALAAYA